MPAKKIDGVPAVDRQQLVIKNRALAFHFVNRFADSGVEYQELIGIADLALVEAASNYDPNRGQFGAYASKCIFGRLMNYVQSTSDVYSHWRGIKRRSFDPRRSDKAGMDDEERLPLCEKIADERAISPERTTANKKAAALALSKLSPRERHIIVARHCCDEPREQEDIARELGISRRQVIRIEQDALAKMRKAIK